MHLNNNIQANPFPFEDEIAEEMLGKLYIRKIQLDELEVLQEYLGLNNMYPTWHLSKRINKVNLIAAQNTIFWYIAAAIRYKINRIISKTNIKKKLLEDKNDLALQKVTQAIKLMKDKRMLPLVQLDWKYYALSLGHIWQNFIDAIAGKDAIIINIKEFTDIVALQGAQDRNPNKLTIKKPITGTVELNWKNSKSVSGISSHFPWRWQKILYDDWFSNFLAFNLINQGDDDTGISWTWADGD
ncbi:MAG: hypothetical protein ACD_3C00229G0002 [uncultured bacterium (gcode 4)]|uniref:Uncharacterized protein n=1 Tax=uncultured bacterium (gcode 4) TaxID=1234023 RepID=K2F7Y0_9BACT|nr:MAG: hypothetical protein ACD_3C00229G0002 [uncultured bacterium (gcode 4)]